MLRLGLRLLKVREPDAVSEPPLVSVTVAVQTILSPTLAVDELKVKVWLVPRVLEPFFHT